MSQQQDIKISQYKNMRISEDSQQKRWSLFALHFNLSIEASVFVIAEIESNQSIISPIAIVQYVDSMISE